MRFPLFLSSLLALGAMARGGDVPDKAAWRSALYPAEWQPGWADQGGHFLHDFSYAGYHRAEKPLPDIAGPTIDVTKAPYSADATGVNDATAAIQAALDAVAAKGGGVVYLPAGTYRIAAADKAHPALSIRGDHTILRGAGVAQTFLFNDDVHMREKKLIVVRGEDSFDWHKEGADAPSSGVTADVPNHAVEVPVADVSPFAVGDLVALRSDLTQRFIDEIEMNGKWTPAGAGSRNRTLLFCRRLTAIDPAHHALTFDVPVRYPVKVADLARVVKLPGRPITEVGLEDFSLGMRQIPGQGVAEEDWKVEGTVGYEANNSQAISIENAENCWIRRVSTYCPPGNDANVHIVSNGLSISRSRFITVQGCHLKFPQYRGGNGNGYLFALQGQETLVTDCSAEGGRHNYDFGTMVCSGNVITRCLAKDGKLASDFHMFLSMSNLLDNITCDGDFLEARYLRPWGGNPPHGVTTTQSVFWNINGLRYSLEKAVLVDSHQVGNGYIIGTRGPDCKVDSDDFVEGIGQGASLLPASLYQDQLARRLHTGSFARQ